jgi:endo-1,3(4)-beta-glucanase
MVQHQEYINWFARDIVNPSSADPYFPITRCRDWFAGHSWASGIANGAGSRDEESSGEAINGYYGALLWASVTGSSADYVHYAKLLLATEQHAAQVSISSKIHDMQVLIYRILGLLAPVPEQLSG